MSRSLTRRAAAVLAAAAAVTLCGTVSAQADTPTAPASADYAAARQVLGSDQVRTTVGRFLTAAGNQAAPGTDGGTSGGARRGIAQTPQSPQTPPRFDVKQPVPMYELAPGFVTGKARPTADGALRLSYLAARVSAADGHQAAVLLAPGGSGGSWQLAGIRDGEADISAAERGTEQARTFLEPQIHAWYRLTGAGAVEPLNKEASTALQGRKTVSLAAYQQLVTKRYGDKQPGSAYDRKGMAGGYALPEDGTKATAAAPAREADSWLPAASAAAAVALPGAAAVAFLRRRRAA
ncbi:hypothetical protein GCM10010218_56130 [Streptomyces mashuensis]|uniref:Secreted protein n=1 Tax=Streptomyces mashuensis TaxID=33904 RepID=A0A919B9E9_9ACTN|nr:hypothetical protein [Streptomyces mashuensis]GHF67421.1 hypothetical protein GCM10010218_56130 [Streptomyces mashuensis]